MRLPRILVSVVAVVVIAFLAVSWHDARLLAGALGSGGRDPQAAIRDLHAAKRLNPDAAPDITRAIFLNGSGDQAGAVRTLRAVVAREPDNRDAWRFLAQIAGDRRPALAARARAAVRRLDPVGARQG